MPRMVIGCILGFLVVVPGGFVIVALSATCSAAIRVWWRRRTAAKAIRRATAAIHKQEKRAAHPIASIEKYLREKHGAPGPKPSERRAAYLPHQRRA